MKRITFSLVVALAAACTQTPGTPLAPASLASTSNAGANGETLKVNAPKLVGPLAIEVEDLDPNFFWENASAKYAGPQSFTYDFELLGPTGNLIQTLSVTQNSQVLGAPTNLNRTSVETSARLEFGTNYTWRVRARLGSLVGPWSSAGAFKTITRFSCSHLGNNPLAIIACHRDRFQVAHMGHAELAIFMRDVAWDFNRVGVAGGPFGMLVKQTGNNCGGYSCDILCSGQGNNQIQYDILIDESVPVWGGGNDIHDGIRADVCEIQ